MFFDARQRHLAQRHAEVSARQAVLRQRLAVDAKPLRQILGVADTVRSAGLWLRAHPAVAGVGIAVLVARRPRRAWRGSQRLWRAWRLWRSLQRWQATLAPWLALRRR